MQSATLMYLPNINHFQNDTQQARLTLLGLVAIALISCMLIIAAVMTA
ncbi:MAG: hypothetical protein JWO36_24 [Myxococcales bacterium]|nr:hypothetical protein [Myxococcales bacterium]